MILDVNMIERLIPHRHPFLLIDRLQDIVVGESAVGIKAVTASEPWFLGHFPSNPIYPGVLLIESLAQTAATLVAYTRYEEEGKPEKPSDLKVYFMSVDEAKFRKPVTPGDVLTLHVQKDRQRSQMWRFKGVAKVGEDVVAESIFTAMLVQEK